MMFHLIKLRSLSCVSLLLAITFLSGCSGGGGSSDNTNKPLPVPTPTPAPTPADCNQLSLTADQECLVIDERASTLFVPSNQESFDGIAIYLHGAPGSPRKVFDLFDGASISNKHNLISVVPEGNGSDYEWNSSNTGSGFANLDIDYLTALINTVQANYTLSNEKVYILGYSAGGFMAYKLACEIPERLTAIVSLAGQFRGDIANCPTSTPLAIHHLHSLSDFDVPYDGREQGNIASVNDTIALWQQKNGCSEEVERIEQDGVTTNSAGTTTEQYTGCTNSVGLSILSGVSHEANYLADKLLATFEYVFEE